MAAGADTGGGGWPGGETRAVQAVHAQPVFRTSVMARAETQSGRVADRWAPEGHGAERAPAMRTLGFADRVIGGYLDGGVHASRRSGAVDRPVAPMNWLFPVPWYLDELDWLSAGRAAAWESERAAVRSGAVAMARPPEAAARREPAQAQAAAATAAVRFDLPLELVAPALAASRASEERAPARAAAPAALRAYSPMVDPAASRAAEFLAELLQRNAARAAEAEGGAAAFRPAPILEYVAPSELVGAAEEASRAQVARAAQQTLEAARQAEAIAQERATRAAQAQARAQAEARALAQASVSTPEAAARIAAGRSAGAQTEESARAAAAAQAAVAAAEAGESARAAAAAAQSEEAARFEAARAEAVRGEATRAEAVRAELARAEAERTGASRGEAARAEAARIEAARGEAARSEAARSESARGEAAREAMRVEAVREAARADSARSEEMRAQAARVSAAAASPSQRAIELLAASALAGDGERMALAAGPRVLMPAGLGGLLAASQQSRAVSEPVARPAGGRRRSRHAAYAAGSPTFADTRPAALEHLVWSDRWLARFAGASASTLRSFDIARPLPAVRAGAAPDWQPAWVSAPSGDRRAARSAARSAPGRVFTAATAPIVDDDQPVGEDVLAAIAAAAASDRRNRQRPARPRPQAVAEPSGPFRAPVADRALARFAMPGTAGLRATLGTSPVAGLVAGLLDGSTHTPFDARSLFAASVSDFLARGAARAASVASIPYRELAQRAPGATWLAMPSAGGGFASPRALAGMTASPAGELARSPLRSLAGGRADLAGGLAASGVRSAPLLSLVVPDADPSSEEASPAGATSSQRARAAAERARSASYLAAQLAAAPRPGSLAAGAERFASARAAAAADLALDFVAPEVLVAARSFGFTPAEAVRAQRLAATGKGEMSRLASLVDQVFVSALSPADASTAERVRSGGAASAGAFASDRLSASELAALTALRVPRGAFLMPAASSRALGLTAGQAESTQPGIAIALELVAAGQVAEVAAQRSSSIATSPAGEPAAEPGGARAIAAALSDAATAGEGRARGAALREAAQERAAVDAARAMLPRALWPVFDAVFVSLGEETVASDVRPLGPAARAARALALAGRARGPEDLPISARARAAAAWAVLPVVLTGGAGPSSSRPAGARGSMFAPGRPGAGGALSTYVAGGAPSTHAAGGAPSTHVAGERATTSSSGASFAPGSSSRPAASRAGEALASLVAPAFFRADDRGDGYGPLGSARSTPSTTFVETGSIERAAPRLAPPPPPPAPRPAPAARPAEPTQKEFEAWFQSAAKKFFGEAPSQSGLTAAEMTLVTSAPRTQIAASHFEAARPVLQAQSAAPGPASGPGASQEGRGQQPNIDKIAQDVYEEIVRMLAIARERSGDPWNR